VEIADVRRAAEAGDPALWRPAHQPATALERLEVLDVVPVGPGWLAIGRVGDLTVTAPLIADAGEVRRARPGDGMAAALLRDLREGGGAGLTPLHRAEVVPTAGDEERWVAVDQSNESFVVDDAVVVKLFPRTVAGAHPGVELPAHLAANGFTEMPAPLGALAWRDVVVATFSVYLPGTRDGWDWYVELVARAAAGGEWADADEAAARIGGLVARLHRALATPSAVITSPTGMADAGVIDGWRTAAAAALDDACEGTPGDEGDRLRRAAPAAHAIVERLATIDGTPVQRVHGDLHVGQILRDEEGTMWVHDFDGNPLAPAAARSRLDASARDVASMVAAIDHVGRIVARRVPDAREAIADWIERARAACVGAYRRELGTDAALFDERLLHPFAIAQEAHEYRYATSYQPPWRYVPDAAMPAAIARAEADRDGAAS
jgi:maltokinase